MGHVCTRVDGKGNRKTTCCAVHEGAQIMQGATIDILIGEAGESDGRPIALGTESKAQWGARARPTRAT